MNIGTTMRPNEDFYESYNEKILNNSKPINFEEPIKTVDEQMKKSRGTAEWQN